MSYRDWHVGMKVVCVDDVWVTGPSPLMAGSVYRVSGIEWQEQRWGHGIRVGAGAIVKLAEVINPDSPWIEGFRAERFRPVQKRKTDISQFTAMLNSQPVVKGAREKA